VCGSEDSDAQKLRDIGIDVFSHHISRNLNPVVVIREIFNIKRMLVQQKIDAVICQTGLGSGVGRIAAWLAKTPVVIHFAHGMACAPNRGLFTWYSRYWAEKLLGYITDAILVMNDYDENLCKERHIVRDLSKIFRVPGMGVDIGRFGTKLDPDDRVILGEELGINKNQKIVLSIAYLVPDKGIFVFLEAAKKICITRSDVCFLLVGTGPAKDKLEQQIKENHLEDSFRLLGWRNDIPQLLNAIDIFVLPTYYAEGLPVSILEAMACSKPVIATQHRGCEDIVLDGRTGYLVPARQVEPLVDGILLLLDDESLRTRMGISGRELIERRFELSYCTAQIVDALEKAIY
jgi:glycosyltransferase involved in cell wall biosynthesis